MKICEFRICIWVIHKLDHWSCIAHLSDEDMLNSAVIEEKKFKHSFRVGSRQPIRAKNFMSAGRPHHDGHLLQV